MNPDFTVKNQIFYDAMDTLKDSFLPYGEKQDIHAFENKFTVTKRIPSLPAWLQVNSLASINYRKTVGGIRSSGGDFDWRQDIMLGDGRQLANNSFWNQLDDNTLRERRAGDDHASLDVMTRKAPASCSTSTCSGPPTCSWASGTTSRTRTSSDTPPFDANFGQIAGGGCACVRRPEPVSGRFNPPAPIVLAADGIDSGKSWSVSLSHRLPLGLAALRDLRRNEPDARMARTTSSR